MTSLKGEALQLYGTSYNVHRHIAVYVNTLLRSGKRLSLSLGWGPNRCWN